MSLRSFFLMCSLTVATCVANAVPYYPSFHNIDANILFSNFSYYPSQGLGLETLSLYRSGSQMLAAGSFDATVKGPWYARANMTTNDFVGWFNQYANQGLRPRELSVLIDGIGQPRFSVIWKQLKGEAYYTYVNMSDLDFSAKWNNLVQNQGYRVEDYISYMVNGQRRHAAIYVRDGKGFYLYLGLNKTNFVQKFNQLASVGYYPTSVNVTQTPQGLSYSAVWMAATSATAMYIDMSPQGYQARFNQLGAQGYRVTKIQGYMGGNLFAAIWKK